MTPVRRHTAGVTSDGLFLNVLWGVDCDGGGDNAIYAGFVVTPATIPGDITVLIGGGAATLVANRTHPTEDFSVYLYRRSPVAAGVPFIDITFAANRTSFSGVAADYAPVLTSDPFRLLLQTDFSDVQEAAVEFAGSQDDLPIVIWGLLDGTLAVTPGPGENVLASQGVGVYLHAIDRTGDVTVPSTVTLSETRGLVVLGGSARNSAGSLIQMGGEFSSVPLMAGALHGTWALAGALSNEQVMFGGLRVTDLVSLAGALSSVPALSGALTRSRSGSAVDALLQNLSTRADRTDFDQGRLDRRVPV